MSRFLKRSFPPGFSYKPELKAASFALGCSAFICFIGFFTDYSALRRFLYIRIGTDIILDESRVMEDFVYILGGRLNVLLILAALIPIIAAVSHYAYYHNGSKSIYLMRRLPNRFELHRQCLLMPLIYALVFVLAAAAMLLICYAIYMGLTPEACLTPNQWRKIWG